jgi:hypothetical protein
MLLMQSLLVVHHHLDIVGDVVLMTPITVKRQWYVVN